MTENVRYFLTVDWCNQGKRGIFCDKDGSSFCKDGLPHTEEEMWTVLGPFALILSPCSQAFAEGEVAEFTRFKPLAEYKGEYGVALKPSAIYYGIICSYCGPVELTKENYDWQMNRPNVGWVCPNCGRLAGWDDERHDASLESTEGWVGSA